MYEWDENKRLTNIEKHRIDFRDAPLLFDGRPTVSAPAKTETEARVLTTGIVNGKFYTLVWTRRGEARRIISFRRSRHDEEWRYRAIYG